MDDSLVRKLFSSRAETFDSENDDFDDVKPLNESTYCCYFPISKLYIGNIRGETISSIQSHTNCEITIETQKMSSDVVIIGHRIANVKAARNRINFSLLAARKKMRPTHFISLPMNTLEITESFEKFKENVLRECPDRGIEDSIFTNKSKLHLTMGVMCLRCDEERRFVTKLLYEANEKVIKPILQGHLPLMIRVKGLACMKNDPNKMNVLYAQVSEEAEESRGLLQRMADELVQFYTKFGYMERDLLREQVRLHVTLINSKYRKLPSTVNSSGDVWKTGTGKEKKRRENFNGTNILEKFSEYDFGVMALNELHISRISSTGRDGYYEPLLVTNLL